MKCKNCKHLQTHEEWCELVRDSPDTEIERECCHFKQKTNADRIRAISNEELATDFLAMFEEVCEDGIPSKEWMMMWLQQPAEEVE